MKTGCSRVWLVLLLAGLASNCSRAELSTGQTPTPQGGAAGAAPATPAVASETLRRAEQASQRFIIVDGHVDLPIRLEMSTMGGGAAPDVSKRTADGEFDYPRARAGGLDAPFMSIYVPATYQVSGGARVFADHLIDLVEGLVRDHDAQFALARSPEDVRKNTAAGKISLPLGIENGAALEGKLDAVAHFRQRGVSYITLTHSKDNDLSDTSYESERTHAGLSALSKSVVR